MLATTLARIGLNIFIQFLIRTIPTYRVFTLLVLQLGFLIIRYHRLSLALQYSATQLLILARRKEGLFMPESGTAFNKELFPLSIFYFAFSSSVIKLNWLSSSVSSSPLIDNCPRNPSKTNPHVSFSNSSRSTNKSDSI